LQELLITMNFHVKGKFPDLFTQRAIPQNARISGDDAFCILYYFDMNSIFRKELSNCTCVVRAQQVFQIVLIFIAYPIINL
jgi:hypothetical protein